MELFLRFLQTNFCFTLEITLFSATFHCRRSPFLDKDLNFLPWKMISSPGASSVPARNEPTFCSSTTCGFYNIMNNLISQSAITLCNFLFSKFMCYRLQMVNSPTPATTLGCKLNLAQRNFSKH